MIYYTDKKTPMIFDFSRIEAVIFDLDGTLIDSLWVWDRMFKEYFESRGYPFPDSFNEDVAGLSFNAAAAYSKERFHMPDSAEDIAKAWDDAVRYFYEHEIPVKKGVKEFLEYLKARHIRIGIATSNFINLAQAVLGHHGVLEYFDSFTCTNEVPREKAFPDVFLEAARRLNTPPEKCLVFEDTPIAVRGAKAGGMQVIAVRNSYCLHPLEKFAGWADGLIEEDYTDIISYIK